MNTQITLVFIFTVTGSCIAHHQFNTEYDKPFDFTCAEPELLTSVKSIHDNHYEDRKWEFRCDRNSVFFKYGQRSHCSWSGFVNEYDKPAIYQCGSHGILQGIKSVHDNHYEDRRWDFYCCSSSAYSLTGCYTTNQLNQYDYPLHYNIPDGYVLHGVTSVHDNHYEDRIFWFQICKLNVKSRYLGRQRWQTK